MMNDALEQGRIPSAAQTAAHLETIQRIAHVIAETDNLGAALQLVADAAAQILEACLVIVTIDDPAARFPPIYAGPESARRAAALAKAADRSSEGTLAAFWPNTLDTSDGTLSGYQWMYAPMIYCNQPLGSVKAGRLPDAAAFSGADERLLSAIADQAVIACETNRLRHLEEQHRRYTETFRETAQILSYSLDLQRLLELILDQVARVVNYDSASIMLLSGDQLTIAAHRGLHGPEQLEIPNQINAYGHLREVIERRRPMIIDDTSRDPRWRAVDRATYIRSWMGVPLVGRDQVIGVLNLDKERPCFYSPTDAGLASTFAQQAAIAIDNARLYNSERRRANQLDALTATIADISSELELARLLEAILERAVTLLNATGGDLGLYDETNGSVGIVACHNLGIDFTGIVMSPGEGIMGHAIAERRPLNIANYAACEYASPQFAASVVRAALAVPFLIGQRIVGAIAITDDSPERRFSESDERLLSLFAQHAAIAVENARLYQSAVDAANRRSVLHEVSQAIVGAAMQPEEIYAAIHNAAARLMPAEAFVIARFNPADGKSSAVYIVDQGKRFPETRYDSDLGLFGRVLDSSQSVYIPDILEDNGPIYEHFGEAASVRSVLAAPMRLRGQVVGMISAQSYRPNNYTEEDCPLLEVLASYAAIALENAALFQNVQYLAITDSLTGLFNRRHLFELGEREFVRARRFNRPLSALMVDIDHFKLVNDHYSHAIGDRALIRLAQVMRRAIREIDIVGRYGGDEFTVILPEASHQTGVEIAERLHQQVNATFFGNSLPRLTVSVGVATLIPGHAEFKDLVHAADLALYNAKNAGRDRVAAR